MLQPLRHRHLHRIRAVLMEERKKILYPFCQIPLSFFRIELHLFTERDLFLSVLISKETDRKKFFICKSTLTDRRFHDTCQRNILKAVIRDPRQIDHHPEIRMLKYISLIWALCRNTAQHQNFCRLHSRIVGSGQYRTLTI